MRKTKRRLFFIITILIITGTFFYLTKQGETISYTFRDENAQQDIVMEIVQYAPFEAKIEPAVPATSEREALSDWGIMLSLDDTDSVYFHCRLSGTSSYHDLWTNEVREHISLGERELVVVEEDDRVTGSCVLYSHYEITFHMSKGNYNKYKRELFQTIRSAQVWVLEHNGNRTKM